MSVSLPIVWLSVRTKRSPRALSKREGHAGSPADRLAGNKTKSDTVLGTRKEKDVPNSNGMTPEFRRRGYGWDSYFFPSPLEMRSGGRRQDRRQFWWLSPEDRKWLTFRDRCHRNNFRSAHPPLIIPEFPPVPSLGGVAVMPVRHARRRADRLDRGAVAGLPAQARRISA
jgi:hypothetical protein